MGASEWWMGRGKPPIALRAEGVEKEVMTHNCSKQASQVQYFGHCTGHYNNSWSPKYWHIFRPWDLVCINIPRHFTIFNIQCCNVIMYPVISTSAGEGITVLNIVTFVSVHYFGDVW